MIKSCVIDFLDTWNVIEQICWLFRFLALNFKHCQEKTSPIGASQNSQFWLSRVLPKKEGLSWNKMEKKVVIFRQFSFHFSFLYSVVIFRQFSSQCSFLYLFRERQCWKRSNSVIQCQIRRDSSQLFLQWVQPRHSLRRKVASKLMC